MKRIIPLLLLLSACTSLPKDSDADPFDAKDPIKPFNQAVFSFNLGADQYVMKPVAETYHYLPDPIRQGFGNFLSNLKEPGNMVNGILQLDSGIAITSFWRFILNSTVGIGGLNDVATEAGLKSRDTDFGKTLGSFGAGEGAYLVLPLAGPSTVRDTTGLVVDWFLDPVGWFLTTPEGIAQMVAEGITTRDAETPIINQFYYESLEPYSATRAAYLQHNAFQ
jgi:phospholipid-binding lipoprotein MlaA